jgi:adenosine deaminase CECR1
MWVLNKKYIFLVTALLAGSILSSCSEQDLANIKLVAHLKKYDQARELIWARNFASENPITRAEWEGVLKVDPSDEFTDIEIGLIKENQRMIIDSSKAASLRKSAIDLEPLRNDPSALTEFCFGIPKGGMLHVHPYGLFTREIVSEILNEYNPVIDPEYFITTVKNQGQVLYDYEIEALRTLPSSVNFLDLSEIDKSLFMDFFFLPKDPISHDFRRFDAIFAFVIWMVEDEFLDEKMEKLYLDFLTRAAGHGISYIEFTNGFPSEIASIEKLDAWSEKFFSDTGVVVRWNLGQLRFLPGEMNADMIRSWNELLIENPSESIVGTDLYAIERGNPALEKAQEAYGYLSGYNSDNQDHPLQMTMHAGEMGDPRNARDAMIMGVSRVGHGVLLKDDLVTIEYARNLQIGIEMNINSNHQLSVFDKNAAPHPFLRFLRLGIPVSLSTDNDGIFDTNISKECIAAVSTTDVNYAELQQMSYNSIATSFASAQAKDILTNRLRQSFTLFEQQYLNR